MFSHITIGFSNFARAFGFHAGLMDILGHKLRFRQDGFAGWQPAEADRPLFLLATPFDSGPASPGNGQMVAFAASSRALVDRAHTYALAQGGRDEGAPGLRAHYHPHYYGAYFRDPDGNKICVVCHSPD